MNYVLVNHNIRENSSQEANNVKKLLKQFKISLKILNNSKTINRNIQSNNVKVIYLLGQENEIQFDNVKNYFNNTCFESKTIIEKRFSVHEIVKC